jgi:hypothetical protein
MTHRFFRPTLAIMGAVFLLSGCDAAVIVRCPGAAILSDASKRIVLKPGAAAADPAAALYTVELTGIDTTCITDTRRGQTDSDVTLSFRASRAPTSQASRYTVPYFLAVNQAERVLNRRSFTISVNFAPGTTSVDFQVTLRSNLLKLENGHLPTEYQFLAGLEMSDIERAYLQTMSRYAP